MPLWPGPALDARLAGDPGYAAELPDQAEEALIFRWFRTSVKDPEPQGLDLQGMAIEMGPAGALIGQDDPGKLLDLAIATDAAAPAEGFYFGLVFAGVGPGLACDVVLKSADRKEQPLAQERHHVARLGGEHGILDSLVRVMENHERAQPYRCRLCGKVHRANH